jgi:hypothetical protein
VCERKNPRGYSKNFALIASQRKSPREAVAKASLQRVLTSLGDAVLVPLLLQAQGHRSGGKMGNGAGEGGQRADCPRGEEEKQEEGSGRMLAVSAGASALSN